MNLNNKDIYIQKLYKAQKLALYWLLGLIYSGFIGLQLGRIQAIADYNYNLHEIMYAPFNIALFVVPVVFLILIRKGKTKDEFKNNISSSIDNSIYHRCCFYNSSTIP